MSAPFEVNPIGYVHSTLRERSGAPRQPWEGAPEARIEILPQYSEALEGLKPGDDVWILTWLHQARPAVLQVHPRGNLQNPLTGVFATRSPDRPNPIGLHRTRLTGIEGCRLNIANLEAIDGTPVIDIKAVLEIGAA